MIKAVLFDLDDTLLGNPVEPFTLNYLGLLGRFMHERLGLEDLAPLMLAAIRAVFEDRDPLRTNWDAFFEILEPALPVSRPAFDDAAAEFYREVFPELRAGTTLRPGARRLVSRLLAEGCTVAVATNPLFPRVAVEQRLAWADCALGDNAFALVTTLENMHFTKPHPEYYEEILARIGVAAADAIMVGDDWALDIVPAWRAGLHTFWLTPNGHTAPPTDAAEPDGIGTLDDFSARLWDEHWLQALQPRALAPEQIAPRLLGNVAALAGVVQEAPEHVWSVQLSDGGQSLLEVLLYLVASEREEQRPRLLRLVRESDPSLAEVRTPSESEAHRSAAGPWALVEAFAAERRTTLDVLAALDPDAWHQPVHDPNGGPMTLLAVAAATAQHDRHHITRLARLVADCR